MSLPPPSGAPESPPLTYFKVETMDLAVDFATADVHPRQHMKI